MIKSSLAINLKTRISLTNHKKSTSCFHRFHAARTCDPASLDSRQESLDSCARHSARIFSPDAGGKCCFEAIQDAQHMFWFLLSLRVVQRASRQGIENGHMVVVYRNIPFLSRQVVGAKNSILRVAVMSQLSTFTFA